MIKDRQERTSIRRFVSRHRKEERGEGETRGKGGRRDRYGNPGENGGRVARKDEETRMGRIRARRDEIGKGEGGGGGEEMRTRETVKE